MIRRYLMFYLCLSEAKVKTALIDAANPEAAVALFKSKLRDMNADGGNAVPLCLPNCGNPVMYGVYGDQVEESIRLVSRVADCTVLPKPVPFKVLR